MEDEKFNQLLDRIYSDTFSFKYHEMDFEFKKRISTEVTMKGEGLSQREFMVYLIANLSKEPKLTVEQVAKLPEDFSTEVLLKYHSFLSPEMKKRIEDVRLKTSSL